MNRYSFAFWLGVLLLLIVASSPASGEPQTRFLMSSVQVVPESGALANDYTFTLNAPVSCPCVLRVTNGAQRIGAGWVYLDGVLIVGPVELHSDVAVLERTLQVTPGQHILGVRVEGSQKSSATVSVTGTIPLPNLSRPRAGHTATTLSNGITWIFGGAEAPGNAAESFNPGALTIQPQAVPSGIRSHHSAVVLPTSGVWIAGGAIAGAASPATEVIDAVSGLGQINPSLLGGRTGHTATPLADGSVLLMGGRDPAGTILRSGETFDPRPDPFSDGTYDPVGASLTGHDDLLVHTRADHTATVLPSGLILVTGGRNASGELSSIELVNPVTQTSTLLPISLGVGRSDHAAVLLPDGRVLVAGGRSGSVGLNSIEVVSANLSQVAVLPSVLQVARAAHTLTLMPWGDVLVAGGESATGPLAHTELIEQLAVDTTAPTVAAVHPVGGALGVDRGIVVSARFSEPIDPGSLNGVTVTLVANGAAIPTTLAVSAERLYLFLLPMSLLAPGVEHTLQISNLRDSAGNQLTPITASFTTVERPIISELQPSHGPAGALVTIVGLNFSGDPDANRVALGGVSVPVVDATTTSLTFVVPEGSGTGERSVTVRTRGGHATAPQAFTVENPAPVLTLVDPSAIAAGSGPTTLTLTGGRFTAGAQVLVGEVSLTPIAISATQLSVEIPATLLSSAATFSVAVVNPPPGGGASNALTLIVESVGPAVAALSVFPRGISLGVGGGQTFSATARYADGTTQNVTDQAVWTITNTAVATVNQVGRVSAAANGVTSLSVAFAGFSATADVRVSDSEPIPTDPSLVAPPLRTATTTPFIEANQFLFEGENPIQRNVTPEAIQSQRLAVLRGVIRERDGAPVVGARVTIPDHPELGYTLSRLDGGFDLAVNGGGLLAVRAERDGYVPIDRMIVPSWRDFAHVDAIVMTPLDTAVTTLDIANATAPQVAQGSVTTDEDGPRRATLVFAPGTAAVVELPNGTTQPLPQISVRATELTVGPNGPAAMPAPLPPTSHYTYAVDYSIDEARAVGGTTVHFSQPVVTYTDNFLQFPAGTRVPAADYDRVRRVWVPSPDGRVISVVSESGGFADLDVDGGGTPASAARLAELGIADSERATIAGLYEPGQSVWRVLATHFSTKDYNHSATGGNGATGSGSSGGASGGTTEQQDNPDCNRNSIIECANQALGEIIPLVGTGFDLHYRTTRVPRRRSTYTISGPLSGSTLPPSLKRIDLRIAVAGQEFVQSFPATPNQRYSYTWNGKDAYGREVEGTVQAVAFIGYVYDAVYTFPGPGSQRSFGQPGLVVSTNFAREEVTYEQAYPATLGTLTMGSASGNGWSFGIHHSFDAQSRTLYYGDGRRSSAQSVSRAAVTVAGPPFAGGAVAITPARQLALTQPRGLVARADGSFLISNGTASGGLGPTYRIDQAGQVQQVADVTAGRVQSEGPDGSLYFVDPLAHVVRRRTPEGQMTVFAGTPGQSGFAGDGGLATAALLNGPVDVAVAPDGAVYISDPGNGRIRRVAPDGVIATYAGGGNIEFRNVDGPALQHSFGTPGFVTGLRGIAVGLDGSVYAADTNRHYVVRVRPDGLLQRFAGNGTLGSAIEGVPAKNSAVARPTDVQVSPDGTIYISEEFRIRRVDTGGFITTISAGGGLFTGAEGVPGGTASGLTSRGSEVAVSPNGNVLATDFGVQFRVRSIGTSRPDSSTEEQLVPSSDGREIYVFDQYGKHLETIDGMTNATMLTFTYDDEGRLIEIVDRHGRETTIERNGPRLTAIVAPGNQRTSFQTDLDGKLTEVAGPDTATWKMTYHADGLLATFTDPNDGIGRFTYNEDGQLIGDRNPATALTQISVARSDLRTTTTLTTAEGRARQYVVEPLPSGDVLRTDIDPAGVATTTLRKRDGGMTVTPPDGTTITLLSGHDPRWSTQVRFAQETTIRTPSGVQLRLRGTKSATFAEPGNPLSMLGESYSVSGNIVRYSRQYQVSNRRLVESRGGRTLVTTYDTHGRPSETRLGNLTPTQFTYDPEGRLTDIVRGSRQLKLTYNAQHRPISITDPLQRETTFTYDGAGRILTQNMPGGRVITFTYDNKGNVASVTPPGRPAHAIGYTKLDAVEEYTPPAVAGTGATNYRYDNDGQLIGIDRPGNQTIGVGYDAGGRLERINFSRGLLSFGYDTAGRVATISAPDGPGLALNYDGFLFAGERWTGTVEGSVERTYGNDLLLQTERVNGAFPVTFDQYDDSGLPKIVGNVNLERDLTTLEVTNVRVLNTYEVRGYNNLTAEPTSLLFSDNLAYHFNANYTRDELGRLEQNVETVDGVMRVFQYDYDTAGRLRTVLRNGDLVVRYTYDDNGNRLAAEGEQTPIAATYDDQDRLLTHGPNSYTYAASGELASRTRFGQTTQYEYDSLGNLVRVLLPDGRVIRYVIDGRGRRVAKYIDDVHVRSWLYAGQLRPVAELDSEGAVISRFVYASRANVPDSFTRGGETYRLLADYLGSPRIVMNASTGEVVQRMDFGPFGERLQDTNPGFQPFGFAGGLYDPDTGLVRFGARDYDPETGRWTAKDPIRFAGGDPNLYGYALADPINWRDPSGHTPTGAIIGAILGGVGGGLSAMTSARANGTSPDVKSVVGAAAIGAVMGGVTGLLDPGTREAATAIGAASGLVNNVLTQTLGNCPFSFSAAALATLGGGAAGYSGHFLGKNINDAALGDELVEVSSGVFSMATDVLAGYVEAVAP
jgi:RHS repeat-associated protein